jgi:hypothetical protein
MPLGGRALLAIIAVAIAAGVGSYALGKSAAPSEAEAAAARRQAQEAAFRSALGPAGRAANSRGHADGLDAGREAGGLDGLVAGRKALARKRKAAATLVWATGDGADGGAGGKAVAELIDSSPVDRFLYLGDVYEGRSLEAFHDKYETTFGRLDDIAAPTPGNHEWDWHATAYDRYWEEAKGRAQPPWYEFALGGWQLLSLNSEADHAPGSPQLDWLEQRLANTPEFGTCRLAYWHRPLRSGGMHGFQSDIRPLWQTLEHKATIVLNGHDHDMQRFAPIAGLTEFVVGSGGRGHYVVAPLAGLEFSNDTDHGALRLRLSRGRASYAFVAVGGDVLDSGTLRCRRG